MGKSGEHLDSKRLGVIWIIYLLLKSLGPTFADVAMLILKVYKTNAKIKNIFCRSASFEINPNFYPISSYDVSILMCPHASICVLKNNQTK